MTRLLVVDDDRQLVDVLSLALGEAGHEVRVAFDGLSAMEATKTAPPELIVSDVNMPRLDGFALCKRLREAGVTIPIVLLTSRDDEIDEALGLELGADDYVTKPFSMRVLIARVGALLRRDAARATSHDAAAAIAPCVALGTGVSGESATRLKHVRFAYRDLPSDLLGLRILRLSDLHLGADKNVEDLEAFLDRLRGDAPDLIVFTGDVAEDPARLDPALSAAIALNPRLGVYASLGNHEYLEGIDLALAVYAKRKDVRLLRNDGESVLVGSSRLWIGGAYDPVFVGADPVPFLTRSIRGAIAGAPTDAFRLLMCHRP